VGCASDDTFGTGFTGVLDWGSDEGVDPGVAGVEDGDPAGVLDSGFDGVLDLDFGGVFD
jgi:hypothetical protein